MDFKRNARYFSKTFARNTTVLAIIGGILAVVGAFVWWYIYYSILTEAIAIVGAALCIGALSQRPSEKYLFEQIETTEKRFRDEAMEIFGYPADAENTTCLIWGFLPGSMIKSTKSGKNVTDRVEFALILLKKGELAVYRQTVSLLKEESAVTDTRLSLKTLAATLNQEAGILTLQTPEETVVLSVYESDYKLEKFLDEIAHRKGK